MHTVAIRQMKQDSVWVAISTWYDPNLLFKLTKKFALKQLDKHQCKTAVLIAEVISILQFHQDNQVSKTTYYDQSTTMVEVAHQAGVCYHSLDLLQDKITQLKMGDNKSLSSTNNKLVVDVV